VDGAWFSFEIAIGALNDQIPGPADLRSLVSTSTQISVDGNPAVQTADPNTVTYGVQTDWPGEAHVQILVVRHTQSRSMTGSIEERGGQWFWVGGGQEIALSPADPCVTRIWPGGHSMSDHDYDEYCKTRILEPPVPPGVVGTVDFAYDLQSGTAGEIRGDVVVVRPLTPLTPPFPARANAFHVHKDLSLNGEFDLSFSVRALTERGFAKDIRPLFRDMDIESMKHNSGPESGTGLPAGFDLSSYDTVKAYASQIFPLVSVQGSRTIMPCDWQTAPWARPGWAAGWPEGRILVFRQWMDQGMPP
jgi:hypothetical protein